MQANKKASLYGPFINRNNHFKKEEGITESPQWQILRSTQKTVAAEQRRTAHRPTGTGSGASRQIQMQFEPRQAT